MAIDLSQIICEQVLTAMSPLTTQAAKHGADQGPAAEQLEAQHAAENRRSS